MPGTVARLEVAPGAHVKAGSPIVVLEAMKMEHACARPHDGVVTDIEVDGGQQVDLGTVLAVVDILAAESDRAAGQLRAARPGRLADHQPARRRATR